jgi:Xaa-Pro aminopeptidase
MKAKKNSAEITHMIQSFERADAVVWRAQSWLRKQMEEGKVVTEVDFAEQVYELIKQSGAWALSFKVISAAGKNGAVIHYSKPNPEKAVSSGELMLLDTGAYYEGGYATDLTRTFLAGGKGVHGSPEQRRIFTLVLKAAISGMSARFPGGTQGTAVDALVRRPLWEVGYTYNHGTGHGVGITVHAAPPSISLHGNYILEPGHIFSIEPGIYIPQFGGVRIENLCTVVEDPQVAGWLCIVPLTFSPLDERLIDSSILSKREKAWLKWYKNESGKQHTQPPEPPVL